MSVPVRFDQLIPQHQERIRQNLSTLASKGASDAEIESYLRDDEKLAPIGSKNALDVRPDITSALPRNRADVSGDIEPLARGAAANVLNAAQGIPGMERGEVLAGMAGSRLPGNTPLTYEQSLAAPRSQTSSIPPTLSIPEKVAGGAVFGSALPLKQATTLGAGIKQGAKVGSAIGAADQALAADPESLVRRGLGTVAGGVIGGGAGAIAGALPLVINKARDLFGLAKRVNESPTAGAQAVAQKNNMTDVDAANYGRVNAQVAAHPTSPDVQAAFDHPTVKTYVDMVRKSPSFANASDADVAVQADQLMTAQKLGLKKAATVNPREAASIRMELRDVNAGQKVLRNAIASPGYKPPITVNTEDLPGVAPNRIETEPVYSRQPGLGRDETVQGPVLPGTAGRARGDLSQVAVNPSGSAERVAPRDVQGPMGPAFQLRADPNRMVRPGVSIETPGMNIETAPPQRVPAVAAAYPKAVAGRAQNEGTAKLFGQGYNDADLIMKNQLPKAKPENVVNTLAEKSPEGIAQKIETMSPADAEKYLGGQFASAKEANKFHLPDSHATAFGTAARGLIGRGVRLNRLSPFVNALDRQAGRTPPVPLDVQGQINALLGIANTPAANP